MRLKRALDQAIEASARRTTYYAVLGKGDEDQTLTVTGRTSFVWARIRMPEGEAVRQVRCRKSRPVYGAPVLVRVHAIDQEMEVVEEDPIDGPEYYGDSYGTGNVGVHATTHGLYGGDTLYIEGRQMLPFLTHPTDPPSLSVTIRPYTYPYGTVKHFAGDDVDLTAWTPTTINFQRLVVTGINGRTNQATYLAGDQTFIYSADPTGVPFVGVDVAALINGAGSPDFIPSAAVRLRYAMTSIEQYDVWFDCRGWAGRGTVEGRAKVSSNDDTFGYLGAKLVAGANVTLTENNDGGNETLTIAASEESVPMIRVPMDDGAGSGSGSSPSLGTITITNWYIQTWAFDQSNQEYVDWFLALAGAQSGLTTTVRVYWTAQGGTVGHNVLWRAVWRVVADDEALGTAGTTDAFTEDALLAVNDEHTISNEIALTGWDAGDLLQLRIERLPSGESTSLAADAHLLGVSLSFA